MDDPLLDPVAGGVGFVVGFIFEVVAILVNDFQEHPILMSLLVGYLGFMWWVAKRSERPDEKGLELLYAVEADLKARREQETLGESPQQSPPAASSPSETHLPRAAAD